jgi:hypothetical protein
MTPDVQALLDEDPEPVFWWGTAVECASALARVHREGQFDEEELHLGLGVLRALREIALEIEPRESLRRRAVRLLVVYPLRAADALQLAASLVWCNEAADAADFVSLDRRLREAASREGFTVYPRSLVS